VRAFHSLLSPYLTPHLLHLGPYYSWASPHHGWVDNEIPQCIHQARKLISKFVSNYSDRDPGDESHLEEMICEGLPTDPGPSTSLHETKKEDEKVTESVRITHIIALAWTASGSKRVCEADDILRLVFSPSSSP
jgi:hypothetical protein